MLDSAMTCAIQTHAGVGAGFTTVEAKTNFVRPITAASGTIRDASVASAATQSRASASARSGSVPVRARGKCCGQKGLSAPSSQPARIAIPADPDPDDDDDERPMMGRPSNVHTQPIPLQTKAAARVAALHQPSDEIDALASEWGLSEEKLAKILKRSRGRVGVEATAELERLLLKPPKLPTPTKAEALAELSNLLSKKKNGRNGAH